MALELFRKQANFIKFMLTHPCARPWFVYVELFLPAFIKLLITVVLFDIEDAIRAHGESIVRDKRGAKGKRHTVRIKTKGAVTPVDRYAQKGLKILLIVTKPLEKIGFAWLVFSAVDQFFYDWQTLLENSVYCVDRGQAGPLTRSRAAGQISFVVGFVPVGLGTLDQNQAGWPTSATTANLPLGNYICIWALTVKGGANGTPNIIIRVKTTGAFITETTESEPIDLAEDEEGDMLVLHRFKFPLIGGGNVQWEIGGNTIPIGIEAVKGRMIIIGEQRQE